MRTFLLILTLLGPTALANMSLMGSSATGDMVLTPGGYRSRNLVHRIGAGQTVRDAIDHYEILGLRRELVKVIPKQSKAFRTTHADGWITYAGWVNNTGTPISLFTSHWTVPAAPATDSGQIIYYFNGLEPDARDAILQPVLQYGSTPAGGGSYWGVASWYVTSDGQAMHTDVVKVNEGSPLVGVMTLTTSGTSFSYTSEFVGIVGTSLPVENISELTWATETLEAYSTGSCSDYPSSDTAFTAIGIQTSAVSPQLSWDTVNSVTDCGQHTSVVSNSSTNGEVDIFTQ